MPDNPERRNELLAHLRGAAHGLTDAVIYPVPDYSTEDRWLTATHTTHHDAPYPPMTPHEGDNLYA